LCVESDYPLSLGKTTHEEMEMKIRVNVASILAGCAVAAVTAGFGFSALAADRVKARDYAEFGQRTDDGAPVKMGDGSKSFWRAIDEDGKPVRTGHGTKKFGRAADEDGIAAKNGGGAKNFWRALNEDGKSLKSGDETKKFGRAAADSDQPANTRAPSKVSGHTLNRNQAESGVQVFEPVE
jgi:hypothetical protein